MLDTRECLPKGAALATARVKKDAADTSTHACKRPEAEPGGYSSPSAQQKHATIGRNLFCALVVVALFVLLTPVLL